MRILSAYSTILNASLRITEVHMSRALLVPVAVLLIACGDSTGPNRSGSMSFAFHASMSGSTSGVFSVEGGRKPYPDDYPTGAGGNSFGDATISLIRIAASRTEGSQEFEMVLSGVTGIGLLPMCYSAQANSTPCVFSGYFFPNPASRYYFGTNLREPPYHEMRVTITELTSLRIRGTFEGIAVGDADTLTISGGAFDVPYR
jgi:hypothetical protein